jgi:hypothetical protein
MEKGIYSTIPIYYTEMNKTLIIDARKGEFAGMLQRDISE